MRARTPGPSPSLLTLAVLAAGCGRAVPSTCGAEAAETCRVEQLTIGGTARTYVVSRRHGLRCDAGPRPLVLFFHGQGSNGSEARADYPALEDEAAGQALFVYPDGLARPELLGSAGWDRDPAGGDVRFVEALIPAVAQAHCVDPARVFAVGHSRGGRFVEVLGCFRPGLFRGLAEASAGSGNVSSCPGQAPIWIAHATDDRQIAFSEGVAMRDAWARRNGCAPPAAEYPAQACTPLAGCPAALPVVWCPYGGAKWEGHYPPPFFGAEVWSFLSAR